MEFIQFMLLVALRRRKINFKIKMFSQHNFFLGFLYLLLKLFLLKLLFLSSLKNCLNCQCFLVNYMIFINILFFLLFPADVITQFNINYLMQIIDETVYLTVRNLFIFYCSLITTSVSGQIEEQTE